MHFCGIEDGETSVFISSFNCIMLVLSDSLSSHTYSSSIEASFVCIPFTLWAYMCIDPLFIQKGWLNFTFNRVGFTTWAIGFSHFSNYHRRSRCCIVSIIIIADEFRVFTITFPVASNASVRITNSVLGARPS